MKTTTTICMTGLLYLIVIYTGFAQQDKVTPRWEIGVDALSLIDKNEYPSISAFLLKEIGENGISLRSRFGFSRSSFENLTADQGNFPTPDDKITYEIFGLLGIQKEIVKNLGIGNRSNLYIGIDFSMSFNEDHIKKFYSEFSNFYYQESKYTFTKFIGSPFLGVSKQLGDHFSIRVEMAILFQRRDFNYGLELYRLDGYDFTKPFDVEVIDNKNLLGIGYGKNRTYSITTAPINQFIISYKF